MTPDDTQTAPAEPPIRSFYALAAVTFICSFSDNAFRLVAWLLAGAAAIAGW